MSWSYLQDGHQPEQRSRRVDEAISASRRPCPIVPGLRQTVVHERNYEEVRELVLLLAEQPIGRDVVPELRGIVALADHG